MASNIPGSHPSVDKAMRTAHHGRGKHKVSARADAREDAADKGVDEYRETI